MKLGEILKFRKDLYFEGAVQADWFYTPDRAAKVAENFVFHGKKYFGIEEQGTESKKRIDTISLVEELVSKLNDDRSNALSLAIADYGTGKSHLAVTMAQLFSGKNYMNDTFEKILSNIRNIDSDAADRIYELLSGRNFVMVINGMRDFNLHSEILKAAQKSLKLYGLPDDKLRKLNRAIETAERFFEINAEKLLDLFEQAAYKRGIELSGEHLLKRIHDKILAGEEEFEIVNDVYREINGQEIRWDEGLSAATILEMLVSEYCGMNGMFDHIILLFDEFGRYLEYTAGVNPAKSGESGLQQIFELTQKTQNVEGYLHVINFIQRDIRQYLETVDQTKNVSRYIGRFDQSDKYYITSNLETVFANLIQRKDMDAFQNIIVKWQNTKEEEWKNIFQQMNKWLVTKGMWRDYNMFRKVIVEGIYPMHPLSTFMLTNLSDYLQNRSSLTLISNYIEENKNVDIDSQPLLIMPEQLIVGDLYSEMLSAEQEGRQKTQHCIKYDNVLKKYAEKLSKRSLMVLRANLILRILRFRTINYEDAISALSLCSGLSDVEIKEELKWLEDEYAVIEFDEHAGVFDFTEESNGAHDFKIKKKRMMADTEIDKSIITSIKIQELTMITETQTTNFGMQKKISTSEWQFIQELYPIEEISKAKINMYIDEWNAATGVVNPKGKLIWLYINRDTDPDFIEEVKHLIEPLNEMPIIFMILNDADNRFYDCLVEYMVLDRMDDDIRIKYKRHFDEDFLSAECNLKNEFNVLKKQRNHINSNGIEKLDSRMAPYLTQVFEKIYPQVVPFFFDGFVTKNNKISGKASSYYCSFLKILLSNSVNEATVHNFVVDMRNRIESLLSVNSGTSWKCMNDKCQIMPPKEKNAKIIYEKIVKEIDEKHEMTCKKIYDIYCKPPYGMSEEAVTLMIAVVCANLNYCLRVKYEDTLKNINIWKDDIITKDDKKVDIKAIKKTTLVFVDAGAVTGKFMRFFDIVRKNKNILEVNHLSRQLEEMVKVDEVPEELEQSYLLTQAYLSSGKKARNEWEASICEVDKEYDEALGDNNFNLYKALVALEKLRSIPLTRIFDDNGYQYDEDSRQELKKREEELSNLISSNIDDYLSNMYCSSIERIQTFENHNKKIEKKLKEQGFQKYAEAVRKKREQELENIEEIRSRQEVRADYEKFIANSNTDSITTHVVICKLVKQGNELKKRVEKYKNSLGKESVEIVKTLSDRLEKLEKKKNRTKSDMEEIWNDVYDLKDYDGLEELSGRITLVLQKGISSTDQEDFNSLQKKLKSVIKDIKKIKEVSNSREQFYKCSKEIKDEYKNAELDFDAEGIIESVIKKILNELDQKEEDWRKENLLLENKSRDNIHKWKEKVKYLPEYLSEKTVRDVDAIKKEADQILSEGKIEDVVYYFEQLDSSEKKLCMEKLKKMIEEGETDKKRQ